MVRHPSSELIQRIRATLQKIEEDFASEEDQPQVAELRRMLLLRIAEHESADQNKTDEPEGTRRPGANAVEEIVE